MGMDDTAGVRISSIDATMQSQSLAGTIAAHLHPVPTNLGKHLRLEETQARFRGGDEKAIRQTNTYISGSGVNIAALEERAANATNLLPQLQFVHSSSHKGEGFREKVRRSKVTRFQSEVKSTRITPGHSGINLGADLQLRNPQSLHANTCCLSSRDHQDAHAALYERARQGGHRLFNQGRIGGIDPFRPGG